MANRIEQFLKAIDAYCAATGRSEARVSTLALNGGGRIAQIRAGRDVGSRILERAFHWLSENWPDGADWPDDVPRPEPSAFFPASSGVVAEAALPAVASTQHIGD